MTAQIRRSYVGQLPLVATTIHEEILLGRPVSPGYAEGTAFVYSPRVDAEVPSYSIDDAEVPAEQRRFQRAVQRSLRELKQLEIRVLRQLGQAQSAIFAAHLSLLQDKSFASRINERISRDLVNVEHALDAEVTDLGDMLASVANEYIRQRAQDIRDLGNRVMRHLAVGTEGQYAQLPPESVIVARELLPSETVALDRENVVGIVTEEGGPDSHAAILARALGIAAITGITNATSLIASGAPLLVNGEKGIVTVKPSEVAIADFALLKSHYQEKTSVVVAVASLDCITLDGTRISLLANINRPDEANLVSAHNLDGVGLCRSELLFLDAVDPPGVGQQLAVYRQVIDALAGRPVVIRTMDLGGDKLPTFLVDHHEGKGYLGSRGLRFALDERTMLETQVRAIVRAASGREGVHMLLPMVLGESDLAEGIRLVRDVEDELNVSSRIPIGAMIETPSALFALDEILRLADFVSIGTNDLTQFLLVADRYAFELSDDYSVFHPSVLRAIAKVVDAGRDAGREVCICGESAGSAKTAALLVGLGARQLSMSPLRTAGVRYRLRESSIAQLEDLAERALASDSAADVRQLLKEFDS